MMRKAAASRRPFGWSGLLLATVIMTLGVGGTFGALWAAGVVDLSAWRREGVPTGWIAVPASAQEIPAYTKLTRQYILEAETGKMKFIHLPPSDVRPEMILDYTKVLGRILDHDKPAGYVFTEADFLPKGARAGLVAGIPSGKRSFTLPADKLAGVFGLKVGDHIDLLSTTPIDAAKGGHSGMSRVLSTQAQMAAMQKRASVRVLAQDAVIVSPVTSRNKPITSRSLTNGSQTRTVPVQEIIVAVDPAEVAPISEAVSMDMEITCVARSGLRDDPGPAIQTPGADPLSETRVIETISGKSRDAQVFSTDSKGVTWRQIPRDPPPGASPAATSPSLGSLAR
jgi:Flp pilus assembly protein CpaB